VGSVQRFGQATMVRDLGYPQSCVIGIGTGGGGVVVLTAMFGAGTQTAVAALTAVWVPRRDITGPPNALNGVDTCSLLDQAALGQVPGLDVFRRDPASPGGCASGVTTPPSAASPG
jgi:hypothetical protein